ncbi:MAG: hypothetical protein Tsb0021_13280 [Chlamydiales bacterium]
MKKILLSLIVLLGFLGSSASLSAHVSVPNKVQWMNDYRQAIEVSKQQDKPILLLFTGSGWCTYCNKLEREVLDTQQFAEAMKDQFIFVKMDFSPQGKARDMTHALQHDQARNRYGINGFPTVIVIDNNERVLLKTGYRQGGAQMYVSYLEKEMGRVNTF